MTASTAASAKNAPAAQGQYHLRPFPERLRASNRLSADGKQNPVGKVGAQGLAVVELLIDRASQVVLFYALTSTVPGCGRSIVAPVVGAIPEDWHLVVLMDGSGGSWRRVAEDRLRHVIV